MRLLIRSLAAAAALCASAVAAAQPQPQPELRLALTLDKVDYLPGEPIVAYLAITNTSTSRASVHSRLDPDLYHVRYLVTGPQGEVRDFKPWSIADAETPLVELDPGASVYGYARLDHGALGWTALEPGNYMVHASYRRGRVVSDRVMLRIVAPKPGAETRHSKRILGQPEVGRFMMFEEGDHLTRAIPVLSELARQRTESMLGAYAAFMLASSFSKPFPNFRARELRPADRRKAIEHLRAAKDALPSFYFTVKAHLLLELNHRRLGEDAQANAARADMERAVDTRFAVLRPWLGSVDDHVERRYRSRQ